MNKFLIAVVAALTIATSASATARGNRDSNFSFEFSDANRGVSTQFSTYREHQYPRGSGQRHFNHWRSPPRGRHGHRNHRRGGCAVYGHGRDRCGPGGHSRIVGRDHRGWTYAVPRERCHIETTWIQRGRHTYRDHVRVCRTSFR